MHVLRASDTDQVLDYRCIYTTNGSTLGPVIQHDRYSHNSSDILKSICSTLCKINLLQLNFSSL